MEYSALFYVVALLACPIGMGAMMWMMGRNMQRQNEGARPNAQAPFSASERLAVLHQQQQALESEIAEVTRLNELETQRDALRKRKQEHEPGPAALVDVQSVN